MGYTTDFSGQIAVVPPLNAEEIAYLNVFAKTRRVTRKQGPYHAVDDGDFGQSDDGQVLDGNSPPPGQPSLWCQWVPTDDGTAIEWDGGEKFYEADHWMKYIIDHFLKPNALAKSKLAFLQANHVCNGTINAQGEDNDDRWRLIVINNLVSTQSGEFTFRNDPEPV